MAVTTPTPHPHPHAPPTRACRKSCAASVHGRGKRAQERVRSKSGETAAWQEPQPTVDIAVRDGYDSSTMQRTHQPQVDVQNRSGPDWSAVRALAAGQAGHFSASQAKASGFSEQLLSKHVASGNLERLHRGIYRLAQFPAGEHEDLVVASLWSGMEAVVSHESALQLHDLSDAMPARIHLTVPAAQRGRRRVVPPLYFLHFADVRPDERAWIGPVPVTTPEKTVRDVAAAHGDAALVAQAIEQGIRRNVLRIAEVGDAAAYAGGYAAPPGWHNFPEDVVNALGDEWAMASLVGRCRDVPPADWPTISRELVERQGGRLFAQWHAPTRRQLHLFVAWPKPGPTPGAMEALRAELGSTLGWR